MSEEEIRSRLRELKEMRGWDLQWIADQTGFSYSKVQRTLSGETKKLEIPWLVRLAELGEVRLEWLITGREPRAPERKGVVDLTFELQGHVLDLARNPTVPSEDLEAFLRRVLHAVRGLRGPEGGL